MRPKKKPGGVVVIAVLLFIFAGCGGIGAAFSVASVVGGGTKIESNGRVFILEEALSERVPSYNAVRMVGLVLLPLFMVAMVVCGIGLLGLHQWARIGAILFAIVHLLFALLSLVYGFMFTLPATREILQGVLLGEAMYSVALVGTIIGAVINLALDVTILIVLLLPSVARAFNGQQLEPNNEDEEYPPQRGYGQQGYPDRGYDQGQGDRY